MARQDTAESGPVSDEGEEVTRRRERLGLDMYELADEAGVSRHTVSAIEAGKGFRRISLTKIQNALDRIEAEVGMNAPPREEASAPSQAGEGTWPEVDRRAPAVPTVIRLRNDIGEVVIEAAPNADRAQMVADAEALLMALIRANRQLTAEDNETPDT